MMAAPAQGLKDTSALLNTDKEFPYVVTYTGPYGGPTDSLERLGNESNHDLRKIVVDHNMVHPCLNVEGIRGHIVGSRFADLGDAEDEIHIIMDTAANAHVAGDSRMLQGIKNYPDLKWVMLADGSRLRTVGVGTLQMKDLNVRVPNVLQVEGVEKNFVYVSVSQLDRDHGLFCTFDSEEVKIMQDETIVGGGTLEDNGTYQLRWLQIPEPKEQKINYA